MFCLHNCLGIKPNLAILLYPGYGKILFLCVPCKKVHTLLAFPGRGKFCRAEGVVPTNVSPGKADPAVGPQPQAVLKAHEGCCLRG